LLGNHPVADCRDADGAVDPRGWGVRSGRLRLVDDRIRGLAVEPARWTRSERRERFGGCAAAGEDEPDVVHLPARVQGGISQGAERYHHRLVAVRRHAPGGHAPLEPGIAVPLFQIGLSVKKFEDGSKAAADRDEPGLTARRLHPRPASDGGASMATQTPSEHRADERAGKNALWVIVGISAIMVIAMIAVVAFYFQWFTP
jgi:hypothetical protein